MSDEVKYALYKYSSHNIGDEIQSLAARQFLPRVDYYIDRDKAGGWKNKNQSEEVKLIANGWYMTEPMQWPITDKTLHPLLTSIHINDSDEKVLEIIKSSESAKYIKARGTIGARDKATLKIFDELGVPAQFSACLTLTLQKDPSIDKLDHILCVSVSDQVFDAVKSKTDRPVIRIDTTTFDRNIQGEEKFKLAEQFLYLYQSAHYVVTTRLHAVFPSMALETPALYITDSGAATYDPSRLEGLKEITNHMSEAEFIRKIDGGDLDLDHPPDNPKEYLEYRKKLTEQCEGFTGQSKAKTFAVFNDFSNFRFENSSIFKTVLYNYDEDIKSRKRVISHHVNITNDLTLQLDQLRSIRISGRKLIGNVKRKIKGIR